MSLRAKSPDPSRPTTVPISLATTFQYSATGRTLSDELRSCRAAARPSPLFPGDGDTCQIRLQRNLYDVIRVIGRPISWMFGCRRAVRCSRSDGCHARPRRFAFGGTIDGSPEWEKICARGGREFEVLLSFKWRAAIVAAAFLRTSGCPTKCSADNSFWSRHQ